MRLVGSMLLMLVPAVAVGAQAQPSRSPSANPPEHEHHAAALTGVGFSELDHRLRDTEAGKEFVERNFVGADGTLSRDEARSANAAYASLQKSKNGKVNDYDLRSWRRQ